MLTGKDDVVVKVAKLSIYNGSPLLAKITGADVLLGGIVASFLFRRKSNTTSVRRSSEHL